MNLVEEKQKVGRLKSTTLIKSILKKTLQREEIEIKFQREEIKIKYKCKTCNEMFKSKKDILMHWHYNHQSFISDVICKINNEEFKINQRINSLSCYFVGVRAGNLKNPKVSQIVMKSPNCLPI